MASSIELLISATIDPPEKWASQEFHTNLGPWLAESNKISYQKKDPSSRNPGLLLFIVNRHVEFSTLFAAPAGGKQGSRIPGLVKY
jgi:hypothetical protein